MIDLLNDVADAIVHLVGGRITGHPDTGGSHVGHYWFDAEADSLACEILARDGLGILSEESGLQESDASIWVIVDPIDGSRNCSAGLPFYGPSLCAIDQDGPFAAVVHNVATGSRFAATRRGGSFMNGHKIGVSKALTLTAPLVCSSVEISVDRESLRNLGAAAHELCLVANGTFDAFIADSAVQRSWDVAAGVLLVEEAGGVVFSSTPLVRGNMDLLHPLGILAAASVELGNELISRAGFRLGEPYADSTRSGAPLRPRLLTAH